MVDHAPTTLEQVERHMKECLAEKERRIGKKFQKLSDIDRKLLRSFERIGWLAHEPEISQEIEQMKVQAGKFRFADLAQVHHRYVRIFVQEKISACSAVTTSKALQDNLLVQRSPASRRYTNIESQAASSQPRGPQVVSEDEVEGLLIEELA